MKINNHLISNMESVKSNKKTVRSTKKFDGLMQNKQAEIEESYLQSLIQEVEEQGARLYRSRSLRELVRFKGIIKSFIKETVEKGLDLKKSDSWDPDGYRQRMQTIETIDKKLVNLTETVLHDTQNSVSILQQVGEIKGLLINLYT